MPAPGFIYRVSTREGEERGDVQIDVMPGMRSIPFGCSGDRSSRGPVTRRMQETERDLATSWTGKIWAQRRGSSPTEPGPIDVMTPEGRYMGSFHPRETSVPDAFGPDGLAAFVERDALGGPVLVVRRLPTVVN